MTDEPELYTTGTGRFFQWVTAHPRRLIAVSVLGIALCLAFLPQLQKDTSLSAFIPDDHPALVNRDKLENIFGLSDPMVVAVMNEGESGVFTPSTLQLVDRLTEAVKQVDGIDPERVRSLATENDIRGTAGGMKADPLLEPVPTTPEQARRVRERVMDFPLLQGSLVARDGSATLIVAELLEPDAAPAIYEQLRTITGAASTQGGERLYVAGEGAVRGFLGTYIDRDARRLNPLTAVIITLVLFLAFRTVRGLVLPNLVVIATVGSALGLMAAFGVNFYVITNSLPVILIGIAVADSIHILSHYYYEQARFPEASGPDLVTRAMVRMWRPITLTTLTTMAGFIGLAAASRNMPPMVWYGIFAAVGVAVAWLYSIVLVPSVLALLRPKPSKAYRPPEARANRSDPFTRWMRALGAGVERNAGRVLVIGVVIAVVGGLGLSRLEMNYQRIDNFRDSEPIYQADQAINRHFDGTHYLDVIVETGEADGMLEPAHLQRIDKLQTFLEKQPRIQGTTAITDYMKQMNKALNEGREEAYALPDTSNLAAQYFLLYNASGSPTDYQHLITQNRDRAHVRARLRTGEFQAIAPVVRRVEQYLKQELNTDEIQGRLTGNVHLTYHWLRPLARNHFLGVAIALALIAGVSALWLGSIRAGVFAAIPVAFAVLAVYAIMGFAGIWLSVGTSMFAAIAIGLGVDFAIHVITRLRAFLAEDAMTIAEAVPHLYATTGRALLFNFLALALGFGVLLFSYVPPLNQLGLLVASAVTTAFVAAMTLLPALVKWTGARVLGPVEKFMNDEEFDYVD